MGHQRPRAHGQVRHFVTLGLFNLRHRQFIQILLPEHAKQVDGLHGHFFCANELKHAVLAHRSGTP